MQYADVAVAVRAGHGNARFTYAIPPELLAQVTVGGLVEVPYRARHLTGVIEQFRRQLPVGLEHEKIRPIRRVLTSWPIFDQLERTLRQRIALETGAASAQTLVQLLPPRSMFKQIDAPVAEERFASTQAQFLRTNRFDRYDDHLSAIQQAIAHQQTVLIVTPTKETAAAWLAALKPHFLRDQLVAFWSGQSVAQQRRVWQAALLGTPLIIIGTRSSCLLPFRRLGLMIIDQPSHPQATEESVPHYSTLLVGRLRHELFGTNLVVWDTVPPLALLTRNERVRWRFTEETPTLPRVHIVARTSPNQLTPTTLAAIDQTLVRGGRVMLITHQRGWAAGLICRDCETIVRCQHCNHLLFVDQAGRRLTCPVCRQSSHGSQTCRRCRGQNLRPFGWGSDRWQQHLATLFQDKRVVVGRTIADIPSDWQILVTSPTWQYLPRLTANLVVSIEPERLLSQVDFEASERWLRTLFDVRARATNYLIVETTVPQHTYLEELSERFPKRALSEELRLRRAYKFPPYGRLLELNIVAPVPAQIDRLRDKVVSLSHKLFGEITILQSPTLLLPDQPATSRIIIKLPRIGNLPLIAKLREELPSSVHLTVR